MLCAEDSLLPTLAPYFGARFVSHVCILSLLKRTSCRSPLQQPSWGDLEW
jgi:hypothetical protein